MKSYEPVELGVEIHDQLYFQPLSRIHDQHLSQLHNRLQNYLYDQLRNHIDIQIHVQFINEHI